MNKTHQYLLGFFSLLPAVLLKWQQRHWDTEDLLFLLYPVQWLIGAFTGIQGQYIAGEGYWFGTFIIEKSCAGLNFLLIVWCALAWLNLHNTRNWSTKAGVLLLSVPLSYLICLLANTTRIVCALLVMRIPGMGGPSVHESVGVLVYLSILLLTCTLFHHYLNDPKHANLA